MTITFSLTNARRTNMLPPAIAGLKSLSGPDEAFDKCRDKLVSTKILQTAKIDGHVFAWADNVTFHGLTSKQAEALYVVCVAESLGYVVVGTTQKVLDKLIASLPTITLDAKGAIVPNAVVQHFPWLAVMGATLVLGGVVYFAHKKR